MYHRYRYWNPEMNYRMNRLQGIKVTTSSETQKSARFVAALSVPLIYPLFGFSFSAYSDCLTDFPISELYRRLMNCNDTVERVIEGKSRVVSKGDREVAKQTIAK